MIMVWLAAGLFAFSFVVGALAGTHNVPLLGSALFAIAGAVASLLAFMEKFFHERQAIAAAKQAMETAPFNTNLATSLGKVLLTLSAGFCTGVHAGDSIRQHSPLLLAETLPTPVPWSASSRPASIDDAIAWLALADRLRRAGLSEAQVREAYDHFKAKSVATSDALKVLGQRWIEANTASRQSPTSTGVVQPNATAAAMEKPAGQPGEKPPTPTKKQTGGSPSVEAP